MYKKKGFSTMAVSQYSHGPIIRSSTQLEGDLCYIIQKTLNFFIINSDEYCDSCLRADNMGFSWFSCLVDLQVHAPTTKHLEPAEIITENHLGRFIFMDVLSSVEQNQFWELRTEQISQRFRTSQSILVLGTATFRVHRTFQRVFE